MTKPSQLTLPHLFIGKGRDGPKWGPKGWAPPRSKFFFLVILNFIFVVAPLLPNYFTTKEQKKSCVIGEIKANFFATIVNWYKYHLTVVSC